MIACEDGLGRMFAARLCRSPVDTPASEGLSVVWVIDALQHG